MRRALLSIAIIALLAGCRKKKIIVTNVIPTVNKTVEFRIVPAADYSQSYYNGFTAEVKLAVYKQFSNPYSTEVIWDTVIAKQAISHYMSMPTPNVITKSFTGLK